MKTTKIKMKNNGKCNHDANSVESTLIFLSMTQMVFPMRLYAVCKSCGRSFDFEKIDGKLKEIQDNKEE